MGRMSGRMLCYEPSPVVGLYLFIYGAHFVPCTPEYIDDLQSWHIGFLLCFPIAYLNTWITEYSIWQIKFTSARRWQTNKKKLKLIMKSGRAHVKNSTTETEMKTVFISVLQGNVSLIRPQSMSRKFSCSSQWIISRLQGPIVNVASVKLISK